MENTYVYLGLALASLLVLFLSRRRKAAQTGLRLPPSPWALPVIGHLHHLVGALPHRAMQALSRRHGPVILLRLGEVPTLLVTSREAASEVLKTHDIAFASRPMTPTISTITNGGRDIIAAPYGEHWRQLRKIAVTELLSVRRVLSFRTIREEEVAAVLRVVAAAAADGRAVELGKRLSTLIADSSVRALIGDRCKDRDVFLREVDRVNVLCAGFNPADLWPSSSLALKLSSAMREAKECVYTVFRIFDVVIQEHLPRLGGDAEDLVDVLLKIQKDGALSIPLDTDVIKGVLFDLFAAGSETSSTALEWAIAELIKNPMVMKKATEEVRLAFKGSDTVVEDRLVELTYLHLVVRETLRLHPPAPLLLPRVCREPCQVLGYDVPLGTQVVVNVWALGRDERYWDAPEEFRPERFEKTGAAVDFKGTDFEYLPFGAGRRMCPGIAFGLANMELALASLLLHFDWEAPGLADPAKFDMTETFGVTARRKAHLLLRPVLRVPVPGV